MITTGNEGPDRKYFNFHTTFDDANFNKTINRMAKCIYVGDDYGSLDRDAKLEVINKHLIRHIKHLARNGDVDSAINNARSVAEEAIDLETGMDEELPEPIKL